MPFINTKVNVTLDPKKEEILKSRLAEAITTFPGKTEQWLMLNFTDNCRLWFHGDNTFPMAFVEVQLLGEAASDACERMTQKICKIYSEELGISPDAIYVKFESVKEWGWNNQTF